MKKLALALALCAISTMSFAGGCWVNGKYVQCAKNTSAPATQDAAL
ncbi:MAG: hypothetical protein V4505_00920 [Pseudomonadota bacterium]